MAENEQILTTERAEKEKLETDAMYKLDHGGKDKEKLKKALPSLSEIQDYQAGKKDDFQLNSTLRRKFREEKKVLADQEEKDNAVRMRTNLSIPLLPEKEEDKKLAALLTYQTPDSYEDKQQSKRKEIASRSWFNSASTPPGGAAGSLLHKLGLQGKEIAVAKALGSSHSPLIRKRTSQCGNKTEQCATITRRKSHHDVSTSDGDISLTFHQNKTNGDGFKEVHIRPTEEADKKLTNGKVEDRGKCSGGVTSLVADYSDSDSESGQ